MPKNIYEIIGNRAFFIDTIGKSGAKISCFEDMVLKIEEESVESDNEYNMMSWLSDKLAVPKIFCKEKFCGKNYLLMSKIEGAMSCSDEVMKNQNQLIKVLAKGLKMLWSVGIADCPYDNSLENKLKLAEIRVKNGLCDMEDSEPETYGENGFESPEHLLEWLKQNKPCEDLVFSHGDYCLPNIFVKNNEISGFIDLGRSGIADKYQDIALCYRNLKSNLAGEYDERKKHEHYNLNILFDELEIDPDWNKIRYYILLDELF